MFRVLGFPVQVQPGFVVFMLLIVMINGDDFGLWLAGAIAAFTLLHELGHALAARRTGAEAEISLSFFAGYASYSPSRPLSGWERAGISFAGPAIQIAVSVAILLAMGVDLFDRSTIDDSPATFAIFWAGPMIGLLNLIPLLPLDGGNIVLTGLQRIIPDRADRAMIWFSIAGSVALFLLLITTERFRGFGIFVGFIFITQLQMLGAGSRPRSPWVAARDALRAGKQRKARRLLIAALSNPQNRTPNPIGELTPTDVAELVALLPDPLPAGDPWNEYLLANFLIGLGRYEDAAHYAADSYARSPHALGAATVARAAGALGDRGTAIGWLQAAADSGTSPAGVANVIDHSPELIGIRQDPTVVAIRTRLATPSPPNA
jgi:Zn-dependent protease